MKAMDHSGLELISNIIVERISTSAIYCFGEKKLIEVFQNPFQKLDSVAKEHTHFYLLVFTNEYIINAVADISDTIKSKTDGRYTVTLLLHKEISVRYLTAPQSFFYHEVLTKGYKVYEDEEMPLSIAFDEIPKVKVDYMRSYWNNRYIVAETFLRSESQIDTIDAERIKESMMHVAVEQLCLGLINVFLGYYPDHFSLAYLFDICELFTPLTSEVFPRTSVEEKKLFDLLKSHPNNLRWSKMTTSSFTNTAILESRCHLFKERAVALVEAELERLENTVIKKAES